MSHLISFDSFPRCESALRLRTKAVNSVNVQIRLVEFSAGFIESEWCKKGHAGYVLDGEFAIDFIGKSERYKKGDIFLITGGEADKHKAVLKDGEKVTLLLFEEVES
ncbi:hypothetical protein FACS1894219_00410 [Clostridia bacterium]|nr:hypothetical protein FACS1894219_00410 [Clostridia bacterium]